MTRCAIYYEDHGVPGIRTDRPALQRLLADVQAGRIDAVVVTKAGAQCPAQ
jgi:DNA invertase Pin-like site-specific DNA recombinase